MNVDLIPRKAFFCCDFPMIPKSYPAGCPYPTEALDTQVALRSLARADIHLQEQWESLDRGAHHRCQHGTFLDVFALLCILFSHCRVSARSQSPAHAPAPTLFLTCPRSSPLCALSRTPRIITQDTTGTFDMAKVFAKHKMLVCMSKHILVEEVGQPKNMKSHLSDSIGDKHLYNPSPVTTCTRVCACMRM